MKKTTDTNTTEYTERYFDWFSALLLLFAMIAAALRLSVTEWTEHLEVTQSTVLWGILLGLAVGKSIYSSRAAFLFFLDYGLIIIPWQLGLLLFDSSVEWQERLVSMGGRIGQVLSDISLREKVSDNILFIAIMAILFWALSVYAGYILVREAGMWRAVVPMGIAALVIETFDPLLTRRSWYLAVYLFLALLMVARTYFIVNTKRWKVGKTYVPSDAGYEQTRVAIAVVLVLVLFSWNIPAVSGDFPVFSSVYRDRIEPLRQKIADEVSFLFSSLRESVGLVYDFYSDQMILGSGSARSDKIEMSVEAPDFLYVGQRFYWRARVYDQYQDGSWQTRITGKLAYTPNDPLVIPDSPDRIQAIFKFRPQLSILTLYGTGQPTNFSRPGNLQALTNLDGTVDLVAFKASPYIRAGEVYEVTASLPSFSEKDLRSAGVDYPDWVTDRYLQLPEEMTPRTLELARTIAENQDNPYDTAKAITDYLRREIEYVETIDQSPGSQEPVDWFLFEYKKGFCNYYATAEIVLLRSLGIPARLVIGYAQGEENQLEEDLSLRQEDRLNAGFSDQVVIYTVRQRDAHAWPEVFFPGLGWVEFEPTVSQEPIFRPSGEPLPFDPQGGVEPELPPKDMLPDRENGPLDDIIEPEEQTEKINLLGIGIGLIILSVVIGLIGFALFARQRKLPVWLAIARRVRSQYTPIPVRLERSMRKLGIKPPAFLVNKARYHLLPDLSKAYVEIDRALSRLGQVPHPSQTPAERAADLVRLLPTSTTAIDQLVSEYHLGTYSPYQADPSVAREAGVIIRQQSRIALLKKYMDNLKINLKRKFRIRGLNGW